MTDDGELREFRASLLKDLEDHEYALLYLRAAYEDYKDDKDLPAFLTAIEDIKEAQGWASREERLKKLFTVKIPDDYYGR